MTNPRALIIPPRGLGFALPGEPAPGDVVAEALPPPILPAISSRMLQRPAHMNRIIEGLPYGHPAKRLRYYDRIGGLRNFDRIGIRIKNLQESETLVQRSIQARLVTAAVYGVAGFGVMGDVFLSGAMGHAPWAIFSGLGVVAGIFGFVRSAQLRARTNEIVTRDRLLDVAPEPEIPFLGQGVRAGAVVGSAPDISDVPDWIKEKLVRIPGNGYIMNCLVTNAMWKKFKGSTPSPSGLDGDDQPVVQVNSSDAVTFAEWLTGLCKGKIKFTLPIEKELDWVRLNRNVKVREWCYTYGQTGSVRHERWYVSARSPGADYYAYNYPGVAVNNIGFRVVVPQDS